MKIKSVISTLFGAFGAFISTVIGPWNRYLETLLIVIVIDILTGIISAVIGKSPKSKTGKLNSKYIYIGMLKKSLIIFIVVLANTVSNLCGQPYIRDAVCLGYIVNDVVSIMENVSCAGVPFPKKIKDMLEVMEDKV